MTTYSGWLLCFAVDERSTGVQTKEKRKGKGKHAESKQLATFPVNETYLSFCVLKLTCHFVCLHISLLIYQWFSNTALRWLLTFKEYYYSYTISAVEIFFFSFFLFGGMGFIRCLCTNLLNGTGSVFFFFLQSCHFWEKNMHFKVCVSVCPKVDFTVA